MQEKKEKGSFQRVTSSSCFFFLQPQPRQIPFTCSFSRPVLDNHKTSSQPLSSRTDYSFRCPYGESPTVGSHKGSIFNPTPILCSCFFLGRGRFSVSNGGIRRNNELGCRCCCVWWCGISGGESVDGGCWRDWVRVAQDPRPLWLLRCSCREYSSYSPLFKICCLLFSWCSCFCVVRVFWGYDCLLVELKLRETRLRGDSS